ncbi:transcriptional regulator domain-containing protein [Caulobacter sp. RL271]|jgi:hypothetical protein|uniref:DUF6499 domain-containing protein n=1 Tax=Caulobacter segnis TaxID=88688 RepID=A0ABY4ZVD6_9CAUL|nr:DUF6499 domain-containing protein [Caulobacter segnis]USQ96706.1 DUF6499 domain-containing protein [Caulobacter segnis]
MSAQVKEARDFFKRRPLREKYRVRPWDDLALNSAMVKSRVADPILSSFRRALRLELGSDRSGATRLAWEFLRRNPAYRADYARVRAGEADMIGEHWGLAVAVDPDQTEVDASVWRLSIAEADGP